MTHTNPANRAANELLDAVAAVGMLDNDGNDLERHALLLQAQRGILDSGALGATLDPASEFALVNQGIPWQIEIDAKPLTQGITTAIAILVDALASHLNADPAEVIWETKRQLNQHLPDDDT